MPFQQLKILALIPARVGSQRVKNKNLRTLAGKPLIAHTIETANKSKLINRIIVSTDSREVANVSQKYKAEIPFLRPKKISQSHSTELEFHDHALNWLKQNEEYEPDLIVNLYPTSPFRKPETIDKAINKIKKSSDVDSLRSVRKCSEHPFKMWRRNGEFLKPFVSQKDMGSHTLSYQLLPEVFIQNTSIYITRPKTIYKYKNTIGRKVLTFTMDDFESIDINSEIDFLVAEAVLKLKKYK